jgi:hypothetical protein
MIWLFDSMEDRKAVIPQTDVPIFRTRKLVALL